MLFRSTQPVWFAWSTMGLNCLSALVLLVALTQPPAAMAQENLPPELVAPTEALSPAEQQTKFHLPPGFEIQLVAAEPDIAKPMNLAFDDAGRLLVSNSLEYPFPVKPDQTGRDSVKILSDFGADGKAGKVETLASGLNIPIGVTHVAGGYLIHSIPNIYFIAEDAQGNLQDKQLLLGPVEYRDTHGMVNSFLPWIDGWVYACHGFANTSTLRAKDGSEITMNSGNTFRFRPDGSHVEFYTHGQVNPFGLSFDPLGNLFSSDCHTLPGYQLLKGAYYPSFGKPHDGLGFGPTIMQHSHGSTGIAGVLYYAADQFPEEYQGTIFLGNPVTGRVNHDKLELHGSSYVALEQPDFITCDDPWFRPVDIKLGPDGAMYIADFYNCIIGHYEVPLTHPRRDRERGRVWRVVYRGEKGDAPAPQAVNVAQHNAEELLADLSHPNMEVWRRATNRLAVAFEGKLSTEWFSKALDADAPAQQRALAAWVAARQGLLTVDIWNSLMHDDAPLVRVHALQAADLLLAKHPQQQAALSQTALAALYDADPRVERAAAQFLGGLPSAIHAQALMTAWEKCAAEDTHKLHVIRMALRDQCREANVLAELAQSKGRDEQVTARLAEVCLGIEAPHAASFLAGYLESRASKLPADGLALQLQHVARHLPEDALPGVYQVLELLAARPLPERAICSQAVLRGLQARGIAAPEAVVAPIESVVLELLNSALEGEARLGLDMARDMRRPTVSRAVLAMAGKDARHSALREPAMEVAAAQDSEQAFAVLVATLEDPTEAIPLRQKSATLLGSLSTPESQEAVVRVLQIAPESLAVTLAQALASRPEGAERLCREILSGKSSPYVAYDTVVARRLEGVPSELRSALLEFLGRQPARDDRLAQLVSARKGAFNADQADAAQGQKIFVKQCAICHRLGGEGKKIGPELDGIGRRGLDRLLEDMLDPSRNVDQAFRATQVETTDGRIISGLLLREEGEVLVLANDKGEEVRIPADQIAGKDAATLSPMPANVAELINEQDFYHLAKYLLSQQQQPAEQAPPAP